MNHPTAATSRNVIEIVIVMLLLLALLLALYDVLRVFFGVFTFAVIFSVSFASLFEKVVKGLKNRRKLAAVLYTIVLILIIAQPFMYIFRALGIHAKDAIQWVNDVKTNGLPPLPSWIANLPYTGDQISSFWNEIQQHPKETITLHEGEIKNVLHRIMTGGAGVLGASVQLIAGIIISAILLVNREKILKPIFSIVRHLFGAQDGPALLNATSQAVRGVAVGVMGTAFIAAVVSWLGFVIAGIPFALGLAALIFFLVLIQIGPLVVLIPLIIWLLMQGHTGWAIFMIIYTLLLMGIDSVLKPVLIAKSGKLPFLVLFLGVIGGMVAWGFTGMFKGAIILAVFYTVFNSWLEKTKTPAMEN